MSLLFAKSKDTSIERRTSICLKSGKATFRTQFVKFSFSEFVCVILSLHIL